jgi:hypothetical protein
MKLDNNKVAHESKNTYWRSPQRQEQFLQTLAQKTLPETSSLYDWSEESNPQNNWFTARNNFSSQNMYQKFKEEEQQLLTELPEQVLSSLKKAKYIVDYGCGNSMTTIQTLRSSLQKGVLSAIDLENKEFIVYDSSGPAVEKARTHMLHFLGSLGIKSLPRVHWILENRNDIQQPEILLSQYQGDKFIFSTWFTVGNLARNDLTHFHNFDKKLKHTLLTTYFTEPDTARVKYSEATYGKESVLEEIPQEISENDLHAMHAACVHQTTNILRASWFDDADIKKIQVTCSYNQDTFAIVAWFDLLEPVEKTTNGQTIFLETWFYPLYQSKRFPNDLDPLPAKKVYSTRWTLVWCDVYDLDHTNNKKLRLWMWATVTSALLLVFATFWYQHQQTNDLKKNQKEQAILALVNKSLVDHKKDWEAEQSDTFKIDLFQQRCQSIGRTLNIIYSTQEFTWSGNFSELLENFLIQYLWEIDQISFFSVDRYVEAVNAVRVELAVEFIKTHPLLDAQLKKANNKREQLKDYQQAMANSLSLTSDEEDHLQNICQWSKVTLIGNFPLLWSHMRNEYTIGEMDNRGMKYIVSVPTVLLEIHQTPNTFFIANDIWSFSFKNNSHIIRWIEELKNNLDSL